MPRRAARERFLARWQQFTAPVMAKAVEDTAFYRYLRLHVAQRRGRRAAPASASRWPPSTAPTRRARGTGRIACWPPPPTTASAARTCARASTCCPKLPQLWADVAAALGRLGRAVPRARPKAARRRRATTSGCCSRRWWASGRRSRRTRRSAKRCASACRTTCARRCARPSRTPAGSARSSLTRTRWRATSTRVLRPGQPNPFVDELQRFTARIAPFGFRNSLAQLALKFTVPGVPDVYQGCEQWNFSLVDPDNRRPVDFGQLAAIAGAAAGALHDDGIAPRGAVAGAACAAPPTAASSSWSPGGCCSCASSWPTLFRDGAYLPLPVEGPASDHALAFARLQEGARGGRGGGAPDLHAVRRRGVALDARRVGRHAPARERGRGRCARGVAGATGSPARRLRARATRSRWSCRPCSRARPACRSRCWWPTARRPAHEHPVRHARMRALREDRRPGRRQRRAARGAGRAGPRRARAAAGLPRHEGRRRDRRRRRPAGVGSLAGRATAAGAGAPPASPLLLLACPRCTSAPAARTSMRRPRLPRQRAALRPARARGRAAGHARTRRCRAGRPTSCMPTTGPAALAPLYLAQARCAERRGTAWPRACVTIHNLAFQGVFPMDSADVLGIPGHWRGIDGVEFWGQLSMLKAGLQFADAITTVSPTYAREIQTPEFGVGLDGVLRARADRLHRHPERHRHRRSGTRRTTRCCRIRYGAGDACRQGAQQGRAAGAAAGCQADAKALLFGVVSRLTPQKGIDLVLRRLPALLDGGGQLVVLGMGDPGLQQALAEAAAARTRSRCASRSASTKAARAPDRGRRRLLPHAVALRALRPEPDVQPGLRHAAARGARRRPGRLGGRCHRRTRCTAPASSCANRAPRALPRRCRA